MFFIPPSAYEMDDVLSQSTLMRLAVVVAGNCEQGNSTANCFAMPQWLQVQLCLVDSTETSPLGSS